MKGMDSILFLFFDRIDQSSLKLRHGRQDFQDIFFQAFQKKAWKPQSPSAINEIII
jgi:hypothetical protein